MIQNVPFHPQEEFQCGPASLAGVLNHWNINVSPDEIASEIYSKSTRGTLNIDMGLYVERRGLKARQYHGSFEDIKSKIDSGYPLIVLVDEGFLVYQKNHFMVVIGYGGEGMPCQFREGKTQVYPCEKVFEVMGKDQVLDAPDHAEVSTQTA